MYNLSKLTARLSSSPVNTNLLVESAANAAVLIPLCIVNNKESILFQIRSSNLNTHANEISFPGGKCELGDIDFIDTALRETIEEIPGLERDNIHILGSLSPVPSKGGKHNVYPIVGYVGEIEDVSALEKNDEEVERVFALSIDYLLDPSNYEMQEFKRVYANVEVYRYRVG
jgi:8-oxo-dGTP pyrophosphatase MutT (NUDIX family)